MAWFAFGVTIWDGLKRRSGREPLCRGYGAAVRTLLEELLRPGYESIITQDRPSAQFIPDQFATDRRRKELGEALALFLFPRSCLVAAAIVSIPQLGRS